MNTKEVARNTNPDVTIKCTQCNKEYLLSDTVIKEEALPLPHNTTVEGFIVCPHCGYRSHTYFMSEVLRFDLDKVKKAIATWHEVKTNVAYSRYERLHKAYQRNFDNQQLKYKEIMARRESDGAKAS